MKIDKSLLFVVFLGIAASYFCYRFIIPYANVVWDEGLAQSWVFVVYDALRNLNLSGIRYAFYSQVVYPPFFSFFYAIPALVFSEFSIQNARIANLVWFVGSGVMVYLLGKISDKKFGRTVGAIAASLLLSAPLFLVHASIGLREIVAVFWSLCTVYFYIRSKASTGYSIATSVSIIALLGIKYQYAVFLLIPIAIEGLIELLMKKNSKEVFIRHILIALPVLLIASIWIFSITGQVNVISDIFFNRFDYTGGRSVWMYIALIPNTLVYMYSASPVIGVVLVFSLVFALSLLRIRTIRIFWIAVMVNITLVLSHTNNIQERYIMLTVPFLYLLAGYVSVLLYKKYTIFFHVFLVLISFFVVRDFTQLPRTVYATGSISMKSPLFNQLDYKDMWFNFDRRTWSNRMPWESKESPADALMFLMDNLDLSKDCNVYGRPSELSPDLGNITSILRRSKKQYPILPYSKMVATIEVLPDSRYYTHDFKLLNAWRISEIRAIEADTSWNLHARREFKELGMIVAIYGK
jgi:hypothetical protein